MSDLDNEWLEALGVDPDESKEEAPVEDEKINGESADEPKESDDSKDDAADTPDDDTSDDTDGDKPDEDGADGGEADGDKKEEEAPSEEDVTKKAVKEALQEIETAKETKQTQIEALKKEVTEALYPEGIDRQLRDSDGDPITGIDDVTKLINPKTGELFTDEEAGAWLLSAQQKLNKDVEEVEKFVEQVAETNATIKEGAERVAEKYGYILSQDEKLRNTLVNAYDKILIKDPKTGVTIKAPMEVEEFFDIALAGKVEEIEKARQAEEAEAKRKAEEEAKLAQSDRGDLKPNGKAENIDPEDKEWAQAIKDYERGA